MGSTGTFSFTVSNVAAGQTWLLGYTEGGILKTTTGTGPATITLNTAVLTTPGAYVIKLNTITNSGSQQLCSRTLVNQSLTITVESNTVAGTISGAATFCKGINSGTLTYSGGNGTIVRWEISTNNGSTWQTTGTTATHFL